MGFMLIMTVHRTNPTEFCGHSKKILDFQAGLPKGHRETSEKQWRGMAAGTKKNMGAFSVKSTFPENFRTPDIA